VTRVDALSRQPATSWPQSCGAAILGPAQPSAQLLESMQRQEFYIPTTDIKGNLSLLRPVFAWNHRWAMQRGFEGLHRELARKVHA
jgi:hypothetical protein